MLMTTEEQERLEAKARAFLALPEDQIPEPIIRTVTKIKQISIAEQKARIEAERHAGAISWFMTTLMEYIKETEEAESSAAAKKAVS